MGKLFFEAFQNLKLNNNLQSLMEEVEITKISSNSKRDFIRVYLNSRRLIDKNLIFEIEREIKNQLFPNADLTIKIYEKFQLSEQYTPSKLMEAYKNSILDELRECSMLEYNLFHMAKCEFEDEKLLRLKLENSVVATSKSDELVRILDKIFNERCGFRIQIQVEYEEAKRSKATKMSDMKIEQEVALIVSKSSITPESEFDEGGQGSENQNQNTQEDSKTKDGAKQEQKSREVKVAPEKKSFNKGGYGQYKKSDNPDVIYGRDFEEEEIPIDSIAGEMGEVVIKGQILTVDKREIRNEKTIIMFNITDFTDTMTVKMFVKNEQLDEIMAGIKVGVFVKIKGVTTVDRFDSELTIASIVGIKKIPDFTSTRMDTNPEKRVELHCHTKMSDMDGVAEVKDLIKRAKKWGHKAIAITDHGVVQGFTDANHAIDHDDEFKIIYGIEAYLVDDLKDIIENAKGQNLEDTFVVFDLETTGFSPIKNKIIEIGAVKVVNGEIVDKFSTFVNPEVPIPFEIEKLTGINDGMVVNERRIEEILPEFMEFCKGAVMVAHNAGFDMSFIKANCERLGLECKFTVVDTVAMARLLLPTLNRFKLDTVAKALGVSLENHHRAVDDAGCTAEIFVKFIEMLKERDIVDLNGVNKVGSMSKETIKKLPTYHAIIGRKAIRTP